MTFKKNLQTGLKREDRTSKKRIRVGRNNLTVHFLAIFVENWLRENAEPIADLTDRYSTVSISLAH
jgi:hypothetical protein